MKELEEIMEMSKRARWETEVLQKANEYMKALQQENTKLKEQIDESIRRYKEIIENKIDEIIDEYNVILKEHKNDLNHINICTHQYNAMRSVLEELLEYLL